MTEIEQENLFEGETIAQRTQVEEQSKVVQLVQSEKSKAEAVRLEKQYWKNIENK